MDKERLDMMYLTNRQTFFKGWVEPVNDTQGRIFIDKEAHPNFPDGGVLPPGYILVTYKMKVV